MRTRRHSPILLALVLPFTLWLLASWSGPLSRTTLTPAGTSAQLRQNPPVTEIVGRVSQDELREFVEELSGEKPVTVGGQPVTFTTRYTPSSLGTLSEQYIHEYFQSLGLPTEYMEWVGQTEKGTGQCNGIRGRNVVAEIKGKQEPGRIYLIGAHLDSISPMAMSNAPGADDNASGTAAVMLAAKILRNYSFNYTVRFVAFTGEERGLCGSNRYARAARERNEDIRGFINLDMIAYDSNGVKDVEINVGSRADSRSLADLMAQNIQAHGLDLVPRVSDFGASSDHASFWLYNYPAIHGSEYLFSGDMNPYYHSVTCCDRVQSMDLGMATDFAKAGVATLAMLGGVQRGSSVQTPAAQPNGTPVPTVPIPGTGSRLFPETGKSVAGLFLDYWQANGGLPQQGYPISELLGEVSPLDGKPYTVQYTERAVFEYHPENQAPYNVLLSQLGLFRYKEKYPSGAPNQQPNISAGSVLFPETGKRVGGAFLDYWRKNGEVRQQGYPISEEFIEKSDLDGKEYRVQYFERAVFELHMENQPPYNVLLSQLGQFRYKEKYGK